MQKMDEVKSLELLKLQVKLTKTLEKSLFTIISNVLTDEKLVIVSSFGDELENSTFFMSAEDDLDGLVIGAHITLETKVLTTSLIKKIQSIAAEYSVFGFPPEYNTKDETGTIAFQVVYNFVRYSEKNFMLYVNNFKCCIMALFDDIQRCLDHQDMFFMDLSMFETADWSIFDPSTYIIERDKNFSGSWDVYAKHLKKNLKKKEKLAELLYVEMCQEFEQVNDIPIDLAYDYIIDNIMQYVLDENKDRIVN